jgi:hypothetical protein
MNKIVYLAVVLASASAFAQGTVNFRNKVTADSINAPIYDVGGTTPLVSTAASPSFYVQLYAGASGAAESSLTPVGVAINVISAGLFNGSTVDVGMDPTKGGTFEVRAWQATTSGAQTYDAAVGAGLKVGKSNLITLASLGGGSPPTPPVNLIGLQSFSLIASVPEPATLALGALGALSLLAFRRK